MSEVKIPQALLNVIADVNVDEINSHIYTNESLTNWLCAWHEEIKRELYDFANNHELYHQGRVDMLMPYDVESVEDLITNVTKKAREDAIKECLEIVKDCFGLGTLEMIRRMKQLKEKIND